MKKTLIFILAAVMVLSTGTATALAANERRQGNNTARRASEASYSQSSTCPYRESTSAGSNSDAATPTRKRQQSFKDENGDGVCDNYTTSKQNTNKGSQNSQSSANTNGERKRQRDNRKENCTGMNYRDENSDGICDNYSPEKCGGQRGTRNGRR